MKTMIIGLSPEYNYPGDYSEWRKNTTRYASNHGASLICNSLLRQFDADYVDDFSDPKALREKYDFCVVALATHITSWRDVSYLADAVEAVDLPTLAPSMGVDASVSNTDDVSSIHPSMMRLLRAVSDRSEWIGVRGPHTASMLYRSGFRNVVPVGCPSLYYGLSPELRIDKNNQFSEKPIVAYFRSFAPYLQGELLDLPLLGQDFEDDALFTDTLSHDQGLQDKMKRLSEKSGVCVDDIRLHVKAKGFFQKNYADWFDFFDGYDFVIGARLHGCAAALLHRIPAVLVVRDLRMNEIADFFSIPKVTPKCLSEKGYENIYRELSFDAFNRKYPVRYANYLNFLEENRAPHRLEKVQCFNTFTCEVDSIAILYQQLEVTRNALGKLEAECRLHSNRSFLKRFFRLSLKVPGLRRLALNVRNHLHQPDKK